MQGTSQTKKMARHVFAAEQISRRRRRRPAQGPGGWGGARKQMNYRQIVEITLNN